jgi:hypothetical protein
MTAGAARFTTGAKDCFIAGALSGTTRCCWAAAGEVANAASNTARTLLRLKFKANLIIVLSYRALEANQRFRAWS